MKELSIHAKKTDTYLFIMRWEEEMPLALTLYCAGNKDAAVDCVPGRKVSSCWLVEWLRGLVEVEAEQVEAVEAACTVVIGRKESPKIIPTPTPTPNIVTAAFIAT